MTIVPVSGGSPPANLSSTDGPPLGAHVSSAGGTVNAPPRATAIEADAFQLFTKQANRWAERECESEEVESFRAALIASGARATCAHDSYLINLASPDPVLRARSIASFEAELRRCSALGLDYLVSHPGNYMDDRASGIARNADGIAEALESTRPTTMLLLETTAGQGTVLGATFQELAELIERVPTDLRDRVGVCLDSCHVYSAGYDLLGDYDSVISAFDDVIGLHRLRMLHLNDSKTPFASRKDRHELIGEGSLGALPFQRIMTDPRLSTVAKVIETPKLEPEITDRRMLTLLRSYASAGSDVSVVPAS